MLVATAAAHADKPRKPEPPQPAATYTLHEVHTREHVTIAVQPGDTRETEPDTRLDYFHHGYMPLRVIVTNDSDKPVELDEARILFVAADKSVANTATEDDLQRRMFTTKQVQPTKVPLIPITIHHAPVDKKIVADMDDFGFQSTTVAPHSTAAGWVFYDVRDLDEPVLDGAEIEIRRVRTGDDKQLDTFEIPLKQGKGRDPGKHKDSDDEDDADTNREVESHSPAVAPASSPASKRTGVTTKTCDDPPCTDSDPSQPTAIPH